MEDESRTSHLRKHLHDVLGIENDTGTIDPFYIVAASPLSEHHGRVLKQGETFAIFDSYGDLKPVGLGEEGIYHEGTRFLSALILRFGKDRPLLLSSNVKRDNQLLAVDLTNPDIRLNGQVIIPRGTLHLYRTKFIWQNACYERLRIRNYGLAPIKTRFSIYMEADFADIFEVRGTIRKERGKYLKQTSNDSITMQLAYEGLDGILRRSRIAFSPTPCEILPNEASFDLELDAKSEANFYMTVSCETGDSSPQLPTYDSALAETSATTRRTWTDACDISTSNERFDDWISRAVADLHMMITQTDRGPYPYAGVPWFSTPFGRDGIITAMECLWIEPSIAKGVLSFLAQTQATEIIPEQDAEPGKILHETRGGEMARLGEIPFGKYYGSVDSTPLFIMLAGAYYERTADREFIEHIWPNIERALEWIDSYGDRDGDGFVEYARHTSRGLVQQGWKDSHDSVFHADGTFADAPIALCEVQGYVYAARRRAAELASVLGLHERASKLRRQAEEIQNQFEQVFWAEQLSLYALALDGHKQPCLIRSSNAGHCLFTGIAGKDHARRIAESLLNDQFFSGWGIRTIASSEIRYNPMSYHNGSIWPHDNALIADGLSRYGFKKQTLRILTGMFDASLYMDLNRLPELFCGFVRRAGEGPTLYPVACAPQAWATAAVFMLVQSCLGLQVRATQPQVRFTHPVLPEFLKEVRIHNLRVGDAIIDLLLLRHGHDVGINVLRREGDVEIVMVK